MQTVILKRTLTATAVTLALATSVQAQTNADSQEALRALMGVDIPNEAWVNTWVWDGVKDYAATLGADGGRTSFTGDAWAPGNEALACDTWAGVLCQDGAITHLEIPFAEMNGEMERVMSALAPINGTLRSLNLVGNKHLHGPAYGLEQYTALEGLYLDDTGLSGELPDLSGLGELRYAGLNDNPGLTGLAGGIGGDKLEVLHLQNNTGFTGDITAVLASSANSLQRLNVSGSGASGQLPDYSNNPNLRYLNAAGSGLGGALQLAANDQIAPENLDTTGTGISSDALGLTPSVGAVTGLSATASGTDALDVSWIAASGATRYAISWSNVAGTGGEREITGGQTSTTLSGLSTGTWTITVTPMADNPNVAGGTVTGTSATISSVLGGDDGGDNGGGDDGDNDGEDTGKKKKGGAALWFGALALIAAARRRA